MNMGTESQMANGAWQMANVGGRPFYKRPTAKLLTFALCLLPFAVTVVRAEESSDPMVKAVAMDAGKVSPSENKLYEESIRTTKESIARETLDVFYHDALDYYHASRYDEALELLDKIYSIDPYYEDVEALRQTISRLKMSHDLAGKHDILEDYMHKGNAAEQAGQNVAAINYWKQALTVNPSYEPAKKKVQEMNHALAQKQYEAGYLYYHRGDMEDALDSWSNAIAMDASFRERGLLLLMSKVELSVHKDQVMKLSAQGYQQYAEKDLPGALQTYEELLTLDPRSDEGRRMAGKIKYQLGQAAYNAANDALSDHLYAQAIKQWQESIRYGFEVQRSQKEIQEVEHLIQSEHEAKLAKRAAKPTNSVATSSATVTAPAAPTIPADPAAAEAHYREGLAAIRSKDYHRAVEELEIASQLNPNDEHIYVARERAKQEWTAANSGRSLQ
jgi:tetratricopeptide (TPR) repeat protein